MKRIKQCVTCGAISSPAEMLCSSCGADISRLEIQMLQESNATQDGYTTEERPSYFMICTECGKLCMADASSCPTCSTELGYNILECHDISDEFLKGLDKSGISDNVLNIRKNGRVIKSVRLSKGTCALGRSLIQELSEDILETGYVSELHCLISNSDDGILLSDVSMNGTYCEAQNIGKRFALTNGTAVDVLGREYFSFSVDKTVP